MLPTPVGHEMEADGQAQLAGQVDWYYDSKECDLFFFTDSKGLSFHALVRNHP